MISVSVLKLGVGDQCVPGMSLPGQHWGSTAGTRTRVGKKWRKGTPRFAGKRAAIGEGNQAPPPALLCPLCWEMRPVWGGLYRGNTERVRGPKAGTCRGEPGTETRRRQVRELNPPPPHRSTRHPPITSLPCAHHSLTHQCLLPALT